MPSGWHPESVEFLGTSSTSSMTRHPLPPAGQTATRLTQSPTHPLETPTRSLLLSVPAINLAGGYRVDSSHDSSPQSTPRLVSGAQAAALRGPACAAVHHLPPGGRLADHHAQTNRSGAANAASRGAGDSAPTRGGVLAGSGPGFLRTGKTRIGPGIPPGAAPAPWPPLSADGLVHHAEPRACPDRMPLLAGAHSAKLEIQQCPRGGGA